MNINNSIRRSTIGGDFIGGNQYKFTIQHKNIPFDNPIFLHYLGEKISRLIYNYNVNELSIINSTKVITLLFDNIIASLSDITQSPLVYNSNFFQRLFGYKINGNFVVSITGTKVSQELDNFLEEREEFYDKPGFYKIASKEKLTKFLDNIKESTIPKRFNTGKTIGHEWVKTFESLDNSNFSIKDVTNNNIKNLLIENQDYFSSNKREEIILIPERLNGFPLVWDSIDYLKLVSTQFNKQSLNNIEIYLASEWINCYLINYEANIPNGLIGINDCTFGINNTTDLTTILKFLSHYKLLDLIISLSFEELMELKMSYAIYIKTIINNYVNNTLIFNTPSKIENRINKIRTSNKKDYKKIQSIIDYLYNERFDITCKPN